MNKNDFLMQFRRCQKKETLEFMIYRKVKKIPSEQIEAFWSAADHRLAEITMGKIFTRIPKPAWTWMS